MNETAAILSVQKDIDVAVSLFYRKHVRLDWEELRGEAQIVALQAIRSYDQSRASLSTWVHRCIFDYFRSSVRTVAWRQRHARKTFAYLPPDIDREEKRAVLIESLLLDLSAKARKAITISLKRELNSEESLARILKYELHWNWKLILTVLNEIKEALTC